MGFGWQGNEPGPKEIVPGRKSLEDLGRMVCPQNTHILSKSLCISMYLIPDFVTQRIAHVLPGSTCLYWMLFCSNSSVAVVILVRRCC